MLFHTLLENVVEMNADIAVINHLATLLRGTDRDINSLYKYSTTSGLFFQIKFKQIFLRHKILIFH
jgi:hypothetical protein